MKRYEVLNIDDDKITLMLHNIIVKSTKLPLDIKDFESAETTVEYLKAHSGIEDTFFFIMLDINMPGMSGWDFLEYLEGRPEIQCSVAMITSSIDGRDKEIASQHKLVTAFYVKPINREDVIKFFTQGGIFSEF